MHACLRSVFFLLNGLFAQDGVRLCLEIIDVFVFLHHKDSSITHRDLKPDNIMFDAHGAPKVRSTVCQALPLTVPSACSDCGFRYSHVCEYVWRKQASHYSQIHGGVLRCAACCHVLEWPHIVVLCSLNSCRKTLGRTTASTFTVSALL